MELEFHTGLRQPAYAVFFAQTAGRGLLDNGLTIGNAHQLGIQAVTLHRELTVLRDEILQIGAVDTLKQLLKGLRLKLRQHDHHPLAGAQPDIGLGEGIFVAGEKHPAVFYPDIFHVHSSQFVTRQTFQSKQGGDDKL